MLPHRRQPSDLAITLPVAIRDGKNERFGDTLWGQVHSLSGRLKLFEKKMQQAEKPCELQGKPSTKRLLGIT